VNFGKSKLAQLLKDHNRSPFNDQKARLFETFQDFIGESEIRDDYTVVGLSVDQHHS